MNLPPGEIVLHDEQHKDEDHHRRQALVAAGLHALRPELVIDAKGWDATAKRGREGVGQAAPALGLAVTLDPEKRRLEVVAA